MLLSNRFFREVFLSQNFSRPNFGGITVWPYWPQTDLFANNFMARIKNQQQWRPYFLYSVVYYLVVRRQHWYTPTHSPWRCLGCFVIINSPPSRVQLVLSSSPSSCPVVREAPLPLSHSFFCHPLFLLPRSVIPNALFTRHRRPFLPLSLGGCCLLASPMDKGVLGPPPLPWASSSVSSSCKRNWRRPDNSNSIATQRRLCCQCCNNLCDAA